MPRPFIDSKDKNLEIIKYRKKKKKDKNKTKQTKIKQKYKPLKK